uniref:E2F transcription factor CC-MB domain-containing protein n=1 Tax=Dicentrarchus labrax TaxID=13489 RepID=A0A8C4DIM5_DICLA
MFVHRGGQESLHSDQELRALIEEEEKLDELIKSCTITFAYLTYEDVQRIPSLKEQTVIVIKAPAETKLEVPHPEESLQVHLSSTQGPIEVFLCSDEPIPMEVTDDHAKPNSGINSISNPPTQLSSPASVSPVSPGPTSLHPASEDQQSFVTLTPPLAFSLDGEEYLLSLAEDEGITDLFSSVDLDHLPLDMPL